MDPDVTLRRLRELAGEIEAIADKPTEAGAAHAAAQSSLASLSAELAELFDALDDWILRGGFLPAAWAGAVMVKGSLRP